MTIQVLIGMITGLGAAVRGNWSPCGESLQAQLHPLGEGTRGNRWGVTIGAFTVGSVLAGGSLTAALGALGAVFLGSVGSSVALALTAGLALAAGALDLSPLTPWTPKRQVNENWIGRYRGWVYGAAFGLQLGLGFAVFVMSWGYYAMLAMAFLSGSASAGALMGVSFGLGRGIILYASRVITTPERLARFHARASALKGPVFTSTGVVTVVAASLALL
jgi:hypothetical protein